MERDPPPSATDPESPRPVPRNERDALDALALEVGGGAAAGAVIGRILGGSARGAVIGAVLGAVAGTILSVGTGRGPDRSRPRGDPPESAGAATGGGRRRATDRTAGASAREALESWTKARLYDRARELEIAGRSKMSKAELVRALRRHPDISPA